MRHQGATSPPWRERIAILALATNSLAIVMPSALVLYNYVFVQPLPISGFLVLEVSVLLAISSIVLGAAGAKRIRVPLMLGGLCVVVCLALIASQFAIL